MVSHIEVPHADPTQLRRQIERLLVAVERFGLDGLPTDSGVISVEASAARRRLATLLANDPRLAAVETLGWSDAEGVCLELARLCIEGQLQHLLAHADIPYPIYNFFAGFEENGRGPWDRVPTYPEVVTEKSWRLLGRDVRFPIGVPASGLTQSSDWIEYFARRGFNVLTYKTVRSVEHRPHRHPHWVFVQDVEPWNSLADVERVRGDLNTWPKSLATFSTANSFGVPSPPPSVWQADVETALGRLADGQLLILSVMGSSEDKKGADLIKDFVQVAKMAEATGVSAIELNLSCPNTVRGSEMARPICGDPETVRDVVEAVEGALGRDTKIVAKLGFAPPDVLDAIVAGIGKRVAGISGINTVQTPIWRSDADVSPFIGTEADPGQERYEAGVSGAAIRELGLSFVRQLHELRRVHKAAFSIIGMGGVMDQSDVADYLKAGADAVQSATGACLNPDLPAQIADGDPAIDGFERAFEAKERGSARRWERLFDVVATGGYSLLSGERSRGGR
jgi:dihydroorotate dehydrogenase